MQQSYRALCVMGKILWCILYFSILLGQNCEINHLKLLENVNQVFHFRVLKMLLPLGIKPLTRHQKLNLHVRGTRIMRKPV